MSPASFRMIVRTGPNPGTTFELTKEVSLAGRDVTNDVVLADPEVSRQHARLTRTPGGYVLEDLGSTNGTFVNGERLVAPRVLNPGDLIGFSENVTATFDAANPEAAATMMNPAAAYQAAPQRPSAIPPAPSPSPAMPPMEEEEGNRRWLLAAGGCILLVILCGVTLFLFDAFAPDILYAPLRWLGIGS